MEAVIGTEESPSEQLGILVSKHDVLDANCVGNANAKYSVGDTIPTEIAVNGLIGRVHLEQFDFDDFFANKAKHLKYLPTKEVKKRGRKRKLPEVKQEESLCQEETEEIKETVIKKKGRPRKIQKIDVEEEPETEEDDPDNGQLRTVKKKGKLQTFKIDTCTPKNEKTGVKSAFKAKSGELSDELNPIGVESDRRFNGDHPQITSHTPRVRKPNSRLQDFVVSSPIGYYTQSHSPTSKPIKELLIKPKEKTPKPIKEIEAIDDPLDISHVDDVVRSFLPIFDDIEAAVAPSTVSNSFKEKENQVNNLQPTHSKSIASKSKIYQKGKVLSKPKSSQTTDLSLKHKTYQKSKSDLSPELSESDSPKCSTKPESLETDDGEYSPPRLRRKINSKVDTPRAKTIRKNSSTNNNSVVQQKKSKLTEINDTKKHSVSNAHNINTKAMSPRTLKADTKPNNSKSSNIIKQKTHPIYGLFDSDGAWNISKPPKSGEIDFNKLVRSLKSVKLPAANWKIRIVVSKQQNITEVTFTNKEINERCVKFSRSVAGYVITFGKSIVQLLGAPCNFSSFNDVSILLDIIHQISLNDPVLEYNIN